MHSRSFQVCDKCNTALVCQTHTDDTQEFHLQMDLAFPANAG
jgi:hypothetical protein